MDGPPQNNLDPGNWLNLIWGGLLTMLGHWLFGRLRRSPRPPREGHGSAYHDEQLRQIIERLEQADARWEGVDRRLRHIERHLPTSGD